MSKKDKKQAANRKPIAPSKGGKAAASKAIAKKRLSSEDKLLIFALVLIVVASAFIAGIFIGKTNDEPGGGIGNVVDLTPSTQTVDTLTISGRLVNADDTAAAGVILRLHSEPKLVVTDSEGYFVFIGVEAGLHTLDAINTAGDVLATMPIDITGHSLLSSVTLTVRSSGGYEARVSADVIMLEFVMEYDTTGGEIDIIADDTMIITDGAKVVTVSGTIAAGDTAAITPSGAVLLPDNTLVLRGGTVVMEDGTKHYPEFQDITTESGAVITDDGKVTLASGIIIQNGEITFVNDTVLNHVSGTAVAIGDGVINQPTTGLTINPSEELGSALIAYQDSQQWDTYINLFGTTSATETPVIQPGSSGSYTFQVKNPNTFGMDINLIISEQQHVAGELPINYRLKSGDIYLSGTADSYVTDDALAQTDVLILAGATATFTVEWLWPLSGNDELDTALGLAENKTHIINVRIYGVQQ